MRLIFVHGIALQGKDPNQLKQLWYEVLQDNLQLAGTALPADVEIKSPFYGDVLFDLTAQLAQPLPLGVKLKGSARSLGNADRLELAPAGGAGRPAGGRCHRGSHARDAG